MSTASPAGPPYEHPPVRAARPQKYRPSGWWFLLGAGLIILAIGIAVGVSIWVAVTVLDGGTTVRADGHPHNVNVAIDRQRMLWTDAGTQTCRLVDRDTGEPVPLHPVSSELDGLLEFAPGGGHLQVTCVQTDGSTPGTVLISAKPAVGTLVGGLLLAIGLPAILGLAGLAVIIVNGVLWSTRLPRPTGG